MANIVYDNWVHPDAESLKHEYRVEYEIKPLKELTGNAFPTFEDFLKAALNGTPTVITPELDATISYRSRTSSRESLLSLIRGYASYPKYRNEETIAHLYSSIEGGLPMTMPIVLRMPGGDLRVMGGNTRMDVAFHLGVNPKALVIEVPKT